MKLLGLLSALVFVAQAQAVPEIPKVAVATCEVQKESIANWFRVWGDNKAFETVVNPMTLELKNVNLLAEPGITNFYRVTIKGYDAARKVVAHRELDQVAVNYSDRVYSVGYTPYDTDRTAVESFSLVIDGSRRREVTGTLAFVPLQSSAVSPFETVEFPCSVGNPPSEPVKVTTGEVLGLKPNQQSELLFNLVRLNMAGNRVDSRKEDLKDAPQVGLSAANLKKIKDQLNKLLSERELPPLRDTDRKREVIVTKGDRCGGIQVNGVRPIYDSLTLQEARKNGEAAKNSIGFVVTSAKCKGTARTVAYWDEDGTKTENKDNWNVNEVIVTTEGLISGYELKYSRVSLY